MIFHVSTVAPKLDSPLSKYTYSSFLGDAYSIPDVVHTTTFHALTVLRLGRRRGKGPAADSLPVSIWPSVSGLNRVARHQVTQFSHLAEMNRTSTMHRSNPLA